jgi:hypothetical protein
MIKNALLVCGTVVGLVLLAVGVDMASRGPNDTATAAGTPACTRNTTRDRNAGPQCRSCATDSNSDV